MREITKPLSVSVDGKPRDPGFLTAECPNVDEFLFLPVAAGMWRQHELRDGTYTLDDLPDAVELFCVRSENEKRAQVPVGPAL